MPALDRYHDLVRNALVKDDWSVSEPLVLKYDTERYYIDLAAEKLIVADKGSLRIAVEVKSIGGPSRLTDLQEAIGQYMVYRKVLARVDPERELLLAIPERVLEAAFRTREIWMLS